VPARPRGDAGLYGNRSAVWSFKEGYSKALGLLPERTPDREKFRARVKVYQVK
jgi:hypothetical protein